MERSEWNMDSDSAQILPSANASATSANATNDAQAYGSSSNPVPHILPSPTSSATASASHMQIETELNTKCGEKRWLKSDVWKHFKLAQDQNSKWWAHCHYCSKKLVGGPKDGTSHLSEHFKRCLKRPVQDIRNAFLIHEQKKSNQGCLKNYQFDHEKSRNDLANMIVLHEYPLSMVDHYGFRKYSSGLQPLFKTPSRNTVKSDIFKIYEFEKAKTMSLLESVQGRIALTTDMWTASNQKKGFMVITSHFIDDKWDLQSRIIRFAYVPCPHTAEAITNVLVETMMDWNIDRKLSTLTVDNCSTNDAVIGLLLDKLTSSELMLNGGFFHMRCCAHILNLIVQDGLLVIGDGIERIIDNVAFWSASPKREQKFQETARQLRNECTKKLFLDCKTRWNSTFLMLTVALSYKDVFSRLKQREPLYKCFPTEIDWELADQVCDKLKLFYDVTEMFSGTKYPTANIYFPKVCEIRHALRQWIICPSEVISAMAYKMVDKFDKYWSVIHGIMGVATVLDPRYKIKLLNYCYKKIYGVQECIDEVQRVNKLVKDLFDEYSLRFSDIDESQSLVSSLGQNKNDDFLGNFDEEVANEIETSLYERSELDNYLSDSILPRTTTKFDILSWWKTNGVKYPILERMARDILAIPVSTVASESAFSTGGRFVSPHRSRLHPNTLEALMCTRNWLCNAVQDETDANCSTMESDIDEESIGPSLH